MTRAPSGVGLYLHLPFCASRCAYCTFVTSTELSLLPAVVSAACREIEALGRHTRRPLATVYLGGGTPSLVDAAHLSALLGAVDRAFARHADAEVTLEANPDDVSPERLRSWRELGVNRLSIGVQSFDDAVLEMLNRRHTAAQAGVAVQAAIDAGFSASLDLMLGLPGLEDAALDDTLQRAVALRPGHVSVYLLEMDKPHELARLARRRPDLFPDDDSAVRQYLKAGAALVRAGYRHYEVSNFARPGHAARHNTRYWSRLPVLAVGVAAHGHSGRRRWANVADLREYVRRVEAGESPREWSRRLDDDEAARETVMLGLRLARGVPDEAVGLAARSAPDLPSRLEDFVRLGLARRRGGRTRLTPRGWLLSNELFETLV